MPPSNAATPATLSKSSSGLIALDQFNEASWRLALQADYALGLCESITRCYNELAKALDEQLGLQPTRETRVMYREPLGQSEGKDHLF